MLNENLLSQMAGLIESNSTIKTLFIAVVLGSLGLLAYSVRLILRSWAEREKIKLQSQLDIERSERESKFNEDLSKRKDQSGAAAKIISAINTYILRIENYCIGVYRSDEYEDEDEEDLSQDKLLIGIFYKRWDRLLDDNDLRNLTNHEYFIKAFTESDYKEINIILNRILKLKNNIQLAQHEFIRLVLENEPDETNRDLRKIMQTKAFPENIFSLIEEKDKLEKILYKYI